MKKQLRVWLDEKDIAHLQQKAKANFNGKGSLTRYFEKIAREQIIFLSEDIKAILRLFNSNNKD